MPWVLEPPVAPPMTLPSISLDIKALAGETLVVDLTVYQDDAQSVPFNLTGATVTIVLRPHTDGPDSPITLALGSGITIASPASGVVVMTQDTTGWAVGRGRWYMKLVDPSGNVSFPLRGNLFVGNP